ncbi:MAG: 4Fe-4S binding protein [Chromatiales bacterium]|nr:4Fe-4S binding protein [Chromatiales bacterium]
MTQLALVIDLNVCVGCHACVTSCKEWNTSGAAGPLADYNPYGADPTGTFFNRVQTFEVRRVSRTPRRCTSRSPACTARIRRACRCARPAPRYKRAEDGIVLVDYDKCIGCKYCSWACPYGARELDEHQKVMKKCTLCVDRIYDAALPDERAQAGLRAWPARPARACSATSTTRSRRSRAPIREQRRLRADAGVGHAARPITTCRGARRACSIHEDELVRADNPLKIEGQLPKPAHGRAAARRRHVAW